MDKKTTRPLAGAAQFTQKIAEFGGGPKSKGGGGMKLGLQRLLLSTAQNAVKMTYRQLGIRIS
jgi:hypothetical protein